MEATPYLNKCTEIILNPLSLNNLKLFVFALLATPLYKAMLSQSTSLGHSHVRQH